MNGNILISVIVPVYNVQNYVEACLNSILSQTYQNFELIIVDDGSSDNSGAICDKIALEDTRIKVFHQENSGVSKARRFALEHSCGDYIVFVDSDDILANDALEYWCKVAERDKADLVITPCSDISDRCAIRLKMRVRGIFDSIKYRKMLGHGIISPGIVGKFFARKLFSSDTLNISKEIKNNEDLLMNFKLSDNLERVSCCPLKSVYYCNVRENSASGTKLPEKSWITLYEAIFSLPSVYQKSASSFISRSLLQRYCNSEISHETCKKIMRKRVYIDRFDVIGLLIDNYLYHPTEINFQLYLFVLKISILLRYIYVFGFHSWNVRNNIK